MEEEIETESEEEINAANLSQYDILELQSRFGGGDDDTMSVFTGNDNNQLKSSFSIYSRKSKGMFSRNSPEKRN